ncbi:MAG TPA: hypothetical protein VJC11_00260, partial [Patescibacteria group bacterium]|nr:hypothetical protein [Patescibacteria group bacterium]
GGPAPAPRIIPPKPPASRSYFYFDVEDEKDVEVFKKHAAVASSTPKEFTTAITKAADKVIASSLVRLPDDVSKKRLQSILMTRFRDIRDSLETKEMLARPSPLGGMGFDAVTIEKIMAFAETEFDVIHGNVQEQRGTSQEELRSTNPAEGEARHGRQEARESIGQVAPVEIQAVAKGDQKKTAPAGAINSQNIRTERPVVVDTNRPKIAEVKPSSRLVGPLDEIEQMNLRDLRRFTQNPVGFIDRIKERMKLLEEESFEKRMSGLSAWRKSPLFQQYLEVIRTALERNVGIPEMIGSVNDPQSSFMNLSEWQTVNRLNRELRN